MDSSDQGWAKPRQNPMAAVASVTSRAAVVDVPDVFNIVVFLDVLGGLGHRLILMKFGK
uniref:Uncharacterized protein n=1 Tax=Oryza sativa subsp. japonica TaxID=39947 RepID=Q6Z6R7_ORYSJ|nr:hypothetical protein [Oryza sativa Japonica Group]